MEDDTNLKIIELINELALLGVRSLTTKRRILQARQKFHLISPVAHTLLREGRPGFLFVLDIARTLDIRGGLTITELAEIIRRPLPTVSRFVEALEDAGIVIRQPNPEDGRSKVVRLTEKGHAIVSELRAEARAPLQERLRRLTPRERQTLERLLAKVAAVEPPSPAAGTGEDDQ